MLFFRRDYMHCIILHGKQVIFFILLYDMFSSIFTSKYTILINLGETATRTVSRKDSIYEKKKKTKLLIEGKLP